MEVTRKEYVSDLQGLSDVIGLQCKTINHLLNAVSMKEEVGAS